MRSPGRVFCGNCLKDFDNIWALKRHYDDCLRPKSNPVATSDGAAALAFVSLATNEEGSSALRC